jgi:hypothetical protein
MAVENWVIPIAALLVAVGNAVGTYLVTRGNVKRKDHEELLESEQRCQEERRQLKEDNYRLMERLNHLERYRHFKDHV